MFISNVFTQNTQEKGTLYIGGGIGKSWSFSPAYNLNQSLKIKSSLSDNFFSPQWSAKVGYVFANHFALELNTERFVWSFNDPFSLKNDVLYSRISFLGMDKCYKTNKSKFAITWLVGLSGGAVFSNNNLNSNTIQFEKNAFNGFGTSLVAALRFEFNKRVYFLAEQIGGYIYQSVRGNGYRIDLNQPYSRTNLLIGVFIFERWNETCNTCPKW
jgi:hypothetical protein